MVLIITLFFFQYVFLSLTVASGLLPLACTSFFTSSTARTIFYQQASETKGMRFVCPSVAPMQNVSLQSEEGYLETTNKRMAATP